MKTANQLRVGGYLSYLYGLNGITGALASGREVRREARTDTRSGKDI
jgi:hypothetical protein